MTTGYQVHRKATGNRKRGGPHPAYYPTAKLWSIAYPPADRIKAVCPACGTVIEWAGVWLLAGTDRLHECPGKG